MQASVIICTRNRAQSLRSVLRDLAASSVPAHLRWELIVVDNGSSDDTRHVVESEAASFPVPLRYIFEPSKGLSRARNTGVSHAEADILAFTDDDVEVGPDWLRSIVAPFEDPECGVVAGRIRPRLPEPVPAWLPVVPPWNITSAILSLDLGDQVRPLCVPPIGASMAFRRQVFDNIGGFSPELGAGVAVMPLGEDTEFGARARKAGHTGVYTPHGTVIHPIGEDRLSRSYLLGWYRTAGRLNASVAAHPPAGPALFGVSRWRFREALDNAARALVTRDPARRFYHRLQLELLRGFLEVRWGRGRSLAAREGAGHGRPSEPPSVRCLKEPE